MKINKAEDTELKGLRSTISFGGKAISKAAQETVNSLNTFNETGEDGEEKQKSDHPQRYLRQKEKNKWNRMSDRKKKKYQKERGSSSQDTINIRKEEALRAEAKETRQGEARQNSFWKEDHNSENLLNGKTAEQGSISGGGEGTTVVKEGTKAGAKEGAKAGANAAGGAATGGLLFAATEAKKTADRFRESLNSQNFQMKMEEVRNQNKDKQGAMELGKYVGATVGLLLAPAITALGSAVALVASSVVFLLLLLAFMLLPLILIVIILAMILCGIEDTREASSGYFGAKYYWIEYETGKTDDSAFATVLGDNGAAFGIQFDYRYTLQPFMNYCYQSDPVAYSAFIPYLSVDKEFLRGNQGLADTWIKIYNNNKEDFIELQKEYANSRYYVPAENKLEAAGIKIAERSEVCQGAVLSFMFQGCRMGIVTAVTEAGITNSTSDEDFIKKLYAYRREQYSRFTSRYEREEQTALGLLIYGDSLIVGDGYLCNPCPEAYISSEFGWRESPGGIGTRNHLGRDYAAVAGTKIYAAQEGTVETVGYNSARGNYLIVNHGNGIKTLYQHCSSILVKEGAKVKQGAVIALVGATGVVTGAHLHFEVWENGTPVDPRKYLEEGRLL